MVTDVNRFVENDGAYCPYCGSSNITYVRSDDYDDTRQLILCEDCASTWYEIYKLVGYELDGKLFLVGGGA